MSTLLHIGGTPGWDWYGESGPVDLDLVEERFGPSTLGHVSITTPFGEAAAEITIGDALDLIGALTTLVRNALPTTDDGA
jgi:hypothetical protein